MILAAAELRKNLARATGWKVTSRVRRTYDPAAAGLWVGCFDTFPHLANASVDSAFDDEIHIEVGAADGIVAGINSRSVLLAVYRYLTELGFRWIRPGREGEIVPVLTDPLRQRLAIHERPAHRHRCVCIEGAVSWEHVRDMVVWLPKLGFNSYFIQFREAYQFFVRWYYHEYNPLRKKEAFSVARAREITARIWDLCAQRGMLVQMMGHGWTCEPFGVPGLGWMKEKAPPAAIRPHLAQIDGKRDWFEGVPLNTQLCYGNPATRKIMVEAVTEYAEEHPHIPIVLFVFADGSNNHCECRRCRNQLPADLYVKICNEIDAALTRRNLPTKIVFDLYVDCLWPPKKESFKNPERFILLFAPITRSYSESFSAALQTRRRIPAFVRNKLKFPSTLADNVAFLRAWQGLFKGDSHAFDYHLMWDLFRDPGHHRLAEVLYEDIGQLKELGLNGFDSCQVQRCSAPSSLLMTVMGRALWDPTVRYEAVLNDLYRSTFGPDWRRAKSFTLKLSELFDPPFMRGERKGPELERTARGLARIPALVDRFAPVIKANLDLDDPNQARSWRYLNEYAQIYRRLVDALVPLALGDEKAARVAAEEAFLYACRRERYVHRVFDVCLYVRTLGRWLFSMTPEELHEHSKL